MLRFAQLASSTASKLFGVFLFTFGLYVAIKLLSNEQDEKEISILSFASIAFGLFIILIHSFEAIGKKFVIKQLNLAVIVGYLVLISSSVATIAVSLFHNKEIGKFMSREIAVLWTLRDSSSLYKVIVEILQNSLDCCKVHSLVRLL